MLLGFKRRFALYANAVRAQWRRFRLWTGSLVACPIHGDIDRDYLAGYTKYTCKKCRLAEWRAQDEAAEAERERRDEERRIYEISSAIRRAHPSIVAAIREAVLRPASDTTPTVNDPVPEDKEGY